MKLYLVQHGDALAKDENPKRPLSQEGSEKAAHMARYLVEKGVQPALIWHSKKERSIQTAHIFAQEIKTATLIARDDLNPLDPVDHLPQELCSLNKDVMIIGHLPFLQRVATLLLTDSPNNDFILFRYCAVACFEFEISWRLVWFINPDIA